MIICKGFDKSDQISSLEEWKQKCPPKKRDEHWVIGRSAYSLASYWLAGKGEVPHEINMLVNSHPELEGAIFSYGSPEYESRFDNYRNGRQHDLLALGSRNKDKILLSVEAKADESFGNESIEKAYMKSRIEQLSGSNTKVPDRIDDLILAIFQEPILDTVYSLRYQLVYAIAGTLAEAQKQEANKAIFLIHTFLTEKVSMKKVEKNDEEVNKLIKSISRNEFSTIKNGEILGPFSVPGNSYINPNIPIYIGKMVTKIDQNCTESNE